MESGLGPKRRRRRVVVVATAIVVSLLAVTATSEFVIMPSRGPVGSTAGPIVLLPSPGTRSACLVGTPGVPRPTLDLRYGVLQGNTYDVPAGTVGHVGMCYRSTNGSMFAYANWSHVGAGGGWFSYPQVTYGVNSWGGAASTYTNQNDEWALPQSVGRVIGEDLWVVSSYRFLPPPAPNVSGYDLSLDNFLTENLPPEFEVGPFVEVEIFLAHDISYPLHWVRWSTSTLVNTTLVDATWDVAYWCHGSDNGTNANVSFDFSYDGQSTRGLNAGTLGVNLSALLEEVDRLAPTATCWTGASQNFTAFHLDEANLGSEDGADGNASFRYDWTVDDYYLLPYATAGEFAELG